MPIANRNNHGRHHSASGVGLRQESTNDNDKADLHHNLRHSGSPNLSLSNGNINGNGTLPVSSHPSNRKRPHSTRGGGAAQSGNAQTGNGQVTAGPTSGTNGSGLEFVDLAAWAADVAPQIAIPADSSSALLAAAAAVSSSHRTLGNRYSPVRNMNENYKIQYITMH